MHLIKFIIFYVNFFASSLYILDFTYVLYLAVLKIIVTCQRISTSYRMGMLPLLRCCLCCCLLVAYYLSRI